MASNCAFCRIIQKELPADVVYRDEAVIAFRDLNPQAPLHLLVCPLKHVSTLNDVRDEDESILGRMLRVGSELVHEAGFSERGFRCVINTNAEGGQSVYHIHLHVLGGRFMRWPPG